MTLIIDDGCVQRDFLHFFFEYEDTALVVSSRLVVRLRLWHASRAIALTCRRCTGRLYRLRGSGCGGGNWSRRRCLSVKPDCSEKKPDSDEQDAAAPSLVRRKNA
jgi:hypothetical protein